MRSAARTALHSSSDLRSCLGVFGYRRSNTSMLRMVGRCRAISCQLSPSSALEKTEPLLVPKYIPTGSDSSVDRTWFRDAISALPLRPIIVVLSEFFRFLPPHHLAFGSSAPWARGNLRWLICDRRIDGSPSTTNPGHLDWRCRLVERCTVAAISLYTKVLLCILN